MSQITKVTKAYTLGPAHIAMIDFVARYNGDSSASAALRKILDSHTRIAKLADDYLAGHITAKEAMDSICTLALPCSPPAPHNATNGHTS